MFVAFTTVGARLKNTRADITQILFQYGIYNFQARHAKTKIALGKTTKQPLNQREQRSDTTSKVPLLYSIENGINLDWKYKSKGGERCFSRRHFCECGKELRREEGHITPRSGCGLTPRTSPHKSRKSSIIGGKTPAARGWGSYHSEIYFAVVRPPRLA